MHARQIYPTTCTSRRLWQAAALEFRDDLPMSSRQSGWSGSRLVEVSVRTGRVPAWGCFVPGPDALRGEILRQARTERRKRKLHVV